MTRPAGHAVTDCWPHHSWLLFPASLKTARNEAARDDAARRVYAVTDCWPHHSWLLFPFYGVGSKPVVLRNYGDRWEKFTVKSQEAVQSASQLAAENGNPEILPVHLLVALLGDREGVIPAVLDKIGVPVGRLEARAQEAVRSCPKCSGASTQPGAEQRAEQGF